MTDVLCFGNLQCDINCRPLNALPGPGELRMIEDITLCLSGNAGNTVMALAKIGVSVDLAGYSGNDLIGDSFRNTLTEAGIGLDKLLRHPSIGTGIAVGAVQDNGEKSVVFTNGANDSTNLFEIPDAWLDDVRILYVASVFVLPAFTGEAIADLFVRAKRRGIITVLNTCHDPINTRLEYIAPALKQTDYFILNEDEGRSISGNDEPRDMLNDIETHTLGRVILTLREDGCLVRDNDGHIIRVPAWPVKVVDTTGAGDTFIAGFIAGLTHDLPVVRCAEMGNRLAAYAITGAGAYQRLPDVSTPLKLLDLQGAD